MPVSPSLRAAAAGARAALALSVGIFPFGLVYGLAVAEAVIDDWVGGVASIVVLAGAAQLALVDLIDQGAPWVVAVATALVINARFIMYSGALGQPFSEFPVRWRLAASHLMTDQAAVTSLLYFETESDPSRRLGFYLGAASTFAASWLAGTWTGILFGGGIPDSWQLGFAIPLMFLALLVPAARTRPGLVAAIVGGVVTVLTRGVPFNLGILLGAAAGISAGLLVRR